MNEKTTTTVHFYIDEDENGDIVNSVAFCSDSCHKSWCQENNCQYGGWDGAFEIDKPVRCSQCGELSPMTTITECPHCEATDSYNFGQCESCGEQQELDEDMA